MDILFATKPIGPEASSQCCIDNCNQAVLNIKRRLCPRHYRRFLKHGDPLATGRPDLGYTLEERFWAKVDKNGPISRARPDLGQCWVWKASLTNGYGQFVVMGHRRGRPIGAHRVAYEMLIGPVPECLDLDHLCRNRACCNPSHLEPVTNEENVRRGNWPSAVNARKTHCIRNHEFTAQNTYVEPSGGRQCRICIQIRSARRRRGAA